MARWTTLAAAVLFATGAAGCQLLAGLTSIEVGASSAGGGAPTGGGGGGASACQAASDCGEASACASFGCDAGQCVQTHEAAGKPCGSGQVCDGVGQCIAASCTDGLLDQDETDVDCGGKCGGCNNGRACVDDDDCATRKCFAGQCAHSVVVNVGDQHACALRSTGKLKCWGRGTWGELGTGKPVSFGDSPGEFPVKLADIDLGAGRAVVAVSAGGEFSCALLDDDALKCWGFNERGQLGLGDTSHRGDEPGEMGDALPAVDLGKDQRAKVVAVGLRHACAILKSGALKCWGANDSGQLGLGDTADRGDDPGEMGDALPAIDLGSGRTARAVAPGNDFTCALLDDGSVKCWGSNQEGRLGLGDTIARGGKPGQMGDELPAVDLGAGRTATTIAAGFAHTCARLDDATVKCWGYNLDGRLGVGDDEHRGDEPGEMGDALPPIALGAGRSVRALTGGSNSMCAILDDQRLVCWGLNTRGELGLGDVVTRGGSPGSMGDALPAVDLGTGRTADFIESGGGTTCAVLDDDSVKCWGANNYGQLGLANLKNKGDEPGEMGDALPALQL